MNTPEAPVKEFTIVFVPGGNQSFVPGLGSLPAQIATTRRTSAPKCPLCGVRMVRESDRAGRPVFRCHMDQIDEPAE